MVKRLIPAVGFIFLLSSCSVFKSLNFAGNKQQASETVQPSPNKFINEISVTPQTYTDKTEVKQAPPVAVTPGSLNNADNSSREENKPVAEFYANHTGGAETASAIQLKYAQLLDTDVDALPNKTLLENVDDWYGVRYRRGGNTKNGVDCSGFTMAVYTAVYGISIPRIAREQYRNSRRISTTELAEGDLLFFNTTGRGITHVGIYLGNNRFIHATVSKGVMVNNLFEPYYLKRYIGAGRIDDKQVVASN